MFRESFDRFMKVPSDFCFAHELLEVEDVACQLFDAVRERDVVVVVRVDASHGVVDVSAERHGVHEPHELVCSTRRDDDQETCD